MYLFMCLCTLGNEYEYGYDFEYDHTFENEHRKTHMHIRIQTIALNDEVLEMAFPPSYVFQIIMRTTESARVWVSK